MKALLLISLIPTAETSARIQPVMTAVEVENVTVCEAYVVGLVKTHQESEDPRELIATCLPSIAP